MFSLPDTCALTCSFSEEDREDNIVFEEGQGVRKCVLISCMLIAYRS